MRPVRLQEPDMGDVPVDEPGLYVACDDCYLEHRKRYAEREGIPEKAVSNYMMC
jgi:hypothetical protein